MNGQPSPVRVLHVLGGLAIGGVETWLMNILRSIDPSRLQMDVVVDRGDPQAYDEEARRLGVTIIHCPLTNNPLDYAHRFRRILDDRGPYDAVHSHVAFFSGLPLLVAARAGVPVRIAHSHTDRRVIEARAGLRRRTYVRAMRAAIDRYATRRLSGTREAGLSLVGSSWGADPRDTLVPYGIALDRQYALAPDDPSRRTALRAGLGIPDDAFVVGHVGRFEDVKNHRFLVEVMAAVRVAQPGARLLFVGDGPLRPEIETLVETRGLGAATTFAGLRRDVPELLRDAVDVLVLPSKHEGWPIILIEAQAAGIPCVVSDVVPPAVDTIPALVVRRSIADPPARWAEAIDVGRARRMPAAEAVTAVDGGTSAIRANVEALERLYRP